MSKRTDWTKEEVRQNLLSSDQWVIRALMALYRRQTSEEQMCHDSIVKNNVGFNGADAGFLSSIALQYDDKGFLSQKQVRIVRKVILKYTGQLTKIANGVI